MSDEAMTLEQLNELYLDAADGVNQFFLFVTGSIVLMMQTGFAFQEAGLVQEKNVVNIMIKNLMDACVGAWVYWLVGYGLAYGEPNSAENSFLGTTKFALVGVEPSEYASFFFQYTFAATGVTIVSGTLAERVSFYGYIIYGIILSGVVYPIVTHWGWNASGWLATLGYRDFAGSGLVHVVGGSAAFFGALILGARRGRFTFVTGAGGKQRRTVHDLPKNNLPFGILGTFILFFGFLAFNGGSQLAVVPAENAHIVMLSVVNTVIAGGSGAIAGIIFGATFTKFKLYSIMSTSCGCLGGLVAICAAANDVDPWIAVVIGLIGGLVACACARYAPYIGIDDPVDAVSIHFGAGTWGVISLGLFSKSYGAFYGHGGMQLGYQLAGWCSLVAWIAVTMIPTFVILRLVGLLRVTEIQEIEGLDIHKHGEVAYDFDMSQRQFSMKNISLKEVVTQQGSDEVRLGSKHEVA